MAWEIRCSPPEAGADEPAKVMATPDKTRASKRALITPGSLAAIFCEFSKYTGSNPLIAVRIRLVA